MSIILNQYSPSERLGEYIEFFWEGIFNTDSTELLSQKVIPNGSVELIIHLSDLHCELPRNNIYSPSPDFTVIGLFTSPYRVNFKGTVGVFGIRLKPEGIYPIFGMPASELMGEFADILSFTGKNFREFISRLKEAPAIRAKIFLAEQYLIESISRKKNEISYLNRALEIIRRKNGLISMEDLSNQVYISTRQLEREFKQKIGLSPKHYMRIARLNEANRKILRGDRINLAELSYQCGYTDQAHFIKDFKSFTGETPRFFLNNLDEFIINPVRADEEQITAVYDD